MVHGPFHLLAFDLSNEGSIELAGQIDPLVGLEQVVLPARAPSWRLFFSGCGLGTPCPPLCSVVARAVGTEMPRRPTCACGLLFNNTHLWAR